MSRNNADFQINNVCCLAWHLKKPVNGPPITSPPRLVHLPSFTFYRPCSAALSSASFFSVCFSALSSSCFSHIRDTLV